MSNHSTQTKSLDYESINYLLSIAIGIKHQNMSVNIKKIPFWTIFFLSLFISANDV